MPASDEASARTRAFARVIGPYVMIVTGIIIVRMPDLTTAPFLSAFFKNPVIVWIMGAMLLLMGLIVIAFHQVWSNLAAALISLFGWFLALRGLALLVAPQLYALSMGTPFSRLGPLPRSLPRCWPPRWRNGAS